MHVVNAGDGRHAHPTQGLLDMYTIRHYKKDFANLTVAIVGDVLHSRVARSDIHALTTLGCAEVRVVGPKTLVPGDLRDMGVRVCHDMNEGVKDADVVIMLRLQNERMSGAMLPSAGEYFKSYGLTEEVLAHAKPDAIVMRHAASGAPHFLARHLPTPIINAGDGTHEHPTQALLDARTIRHRTGHIEGRRVAIIGDIPHSRVARSNVALLNTPGAEGVLVGSFFTSPSALSTSTPNCPICCPCRICTASVIARERESSPSPRWR